MCITGHEVAELKWVNLHLFIISKLFFGSFGGLDLCWGRRMVDEEEDEDDDCTYIDIYIYT